MAAVGARGCWQGALEVWDAMCGRCEPDLTAMKIVMRAAGNAGQWQVAISFLERSTELGADMECFLHATSAVGEGRQWMLALPLLEEAESRRFTPDTACYTAAIQALSAGTQPGEALWLLNDITTIQLRPSEKAYEAAIRSCGELGEWKRALAYLDYMQRGLKLAKHHQDLHKIVDQISLTAGPGSCSLRGSSRG